MEYPTLDEVKSLSTTRMREVLRSLRVEPVRRSSIVANIGEKIIHQSLGNEKWSILEQVAIASLDVGNMKLAHTCISMLSSRFGTESKKVLRLRGMQLEGAGELSEALKVYDRILEEHPTEKAAAWRRVAVLKAQGKIEEAMKELEQQLKGMPTAREGYLELLNLHLAAKTPNMEKAKFCCEELILNNPSQYAFLMLYAEILITEKFTPSSALMARKYYAEAILQNDAPNNSRAVWGLWYVCNRLKAMGVNNGLQPAEVQENSALQAWAEERLKCSYAASGSPLAPHIEEVLKPKES